MKKTTLILCIVLLLPVALYAIIYRHDSKEEQYHALAVQAQFDCVGQILDEYTSRSKGSCVLIGNRYVLTAAHVMVESKTRPDTMDINGMKVTVFTVVDQQLVDITKIDFRFNRRRYKGKVLRIFPDYLNKETKGQCDIALVELEDTIKGVQPAVRNMKYNELHALITAVGFGASGNGSDAEDVDIYETKLAGQNLIDTLEGYIHNAQPALLGFDFDHPDMPQYSALGDTKPLDLEFICGGGDSGGGMFRQVNGRWELIGICTGANTNIERLLKIGYYGNTANYTRVSLFNDWIDAQIAKMEKERLVVQKK